MQKLKSTLRPIILNVLVLILFSLPLSSFGYTFSDSRSSILAGMIETASSSRPGIAQEIANGWEVLDRSTIPIEDLRELRVRVQFWKQRWLRETLSVWSAREDSGELVKSLNEMTWQNVTLTPGQIDILKQRLKAMSKVSTRQAYCLALARLYLTQGLSPAELGCGDYPTVAGPKKVLPILPVLASKWPFERWVKDSEFSKYRFHYSKAGMPIGVKYKGISFQNGDLFVATLNQSADGLYTSFSEPMGYVTHIAIFTTLEHNGAYFPAMIETYEHGVRAVPLNVFLSSQFTQYVEIYRFKSPPSEWITDLPQLAKNLLAEPHGYDFCSQDENRKYLTCSTLGSLLFERMNITPTKARTVFTEQLVGNLNKLDMKLGTVLSPTDYVLDPRLQLVSTWDQGVPEGYLLRALVMSRLKNLFATRSLNLKKLPVEFQFDRWGAREIEKRTCFGVCFRGLFGFSMDNFPNGPSQFLAFIQWLDGAMDKFMEKHSGQLQAIIDRNRKNPDEYSIHDLLENPELQSEIDAVLPFQKYFD